MKALYQKPQATVHRIILTHSVLTISTSDKAAGTGIYGSMEAKDDNFWDEWDD